MMTLDDAQFVLNRVTYKSGFRFRVLPTTNEMAALQITRVGIDSHDPTVETKQSKMVEVSIGKMTDSELIHRLFRELLAWEQHECCEFFRFEYVKIFDPHANVHILREALGK